MYETTMQTLDDEQLNEVLGGRSIAYQVGYTCGWLVRSIVTGR